MVSIIVYRIDGAKQEVSSELLSECELELELIYTWELKKRNHYISVFGSMEGEAGQENKLELPPPIDNVLLFGDVYIVFHKKKEARDFKDLSLSLWETYYEELFGGFESLDSEDSFTEDDEEEYESDAYTKQGYLKDSFVVDDDDDDDDDVSDYIE